MITKAFSAWRLGTATCVVLLAGCTVEISGDDSVSQRLGDNYFGAGGVISLTEPIDGDAMLAGGQVSTAAEVSGDLVVAGGELSIGGRVGDDVYAAGGDVRLDAIVDGNARVAGGDVSVGPATVISGDTALAGGRVEFEGDSKGPLKASGGRVRLGGIVDGDAEVRSEEITIAPGTRIAGKLRYFGPNEPVVPADASIAGGVEYNESDFRDSWEAAEGGVRTAAHWVGRVLLFLGVFVAAVLFTVVFPGFSSRAAERIQHEPLKCGVLGFALLICVPVLVVLLVITVIGIPLALMLMPMYVLLMLLGWVTAALFVGRLGLEWARGGKPSTPMLQFGALLAALALLWLVRRIPVVGGLIGFVALLVGIGALAYTLWTMREASATPA